MLKYDQAYLTVVGEVLHAVLYCFNNLGIIYSDGHVLSVNVFNGGGTSKNKNEPKFNKNNITTQLIQQLLGFGNGTCWYKSDPFSQLCRFGNLRN